MNEDILIGSSFFAPWMLMDYITDGYVIVSMSDVYYKTAKGLLIEWVLHYQK